VLVYLREREREGREKVISIGIQKRGLWGVRN
jgi:hypothetical protein